jgi:hypothetical protein
VVLVIVFVGCIEVQAQWTTTGNDIYNSNSGNVGIGTANPAVKLHVVGGQLNITGSAAGMNIIPDANSAGGVMASTMNAQIYGPSVLYLLSGYNESYPVTGTGLGTISFRNLSWSQGANIASFATESHSASAAGANLRFFTTPNGSTSTVDRLIINQDGYVGIGTTNPSSKLEVNGDVTVSGNISAKYQDIAEWVDSSVELEPGPVVVVDDGRLNAVLASSSAYDTRVAGVVAPMPGIVLGEAGEGKVKVATTGRVKVRVDAASSPIRAGDLLVSSSKVGVAMRSEPANIGGIEIHRPGTLIGKALEPLAEGEGEILVLLSLQ